MYLIYSYATLFSDLRMAFALDNITTKEGRKETIVQSLMTEKPSKGIQVVSTRSVGSERTKEARTYHQASPYSAYERLGNK
jgi:hypothetical protein